MIGDMDDLTLIQNRLSLIAISDLDVVAKKTGVPFGTLFKIKYGTTKNPRFATVKKLTLWARTYRTAA